MAQCVFIFVVSGFPSFQSDLEWDEELLLHFYGKPLEYTAEGELSLFFNLAVKVETGPGSSIRNILYFLLSQVGRRGERHCTDMYSQCLLETEDMRDILRRQGQQPLLDTDHTHLPAMLDGVQKPRIWLWFHFLMRKTTQIL